MGTQDYVLLATPSFEIIIVLLYLILLDPYQWKWLDALLRPLFDLGIVNPFKTVITLFKSRPAMGHQEELGSGNPYVLALSPELKPIKNVKAAIDELAQWRHSGLLILHKSECFHKLECVQKMRKSTVSDLKVIRKTLVLQYESVSAGTGVETRLPAFENRKTYSPAVNMAVVHARQLTAATYLRRFNLSEEETRLLDMEGCTRRMTGACAELNALSTECERLKTVLKSEPDFSVAVADQCQSSSKLFSVIRSGSQNIASYITIRATGVLLHIRQFIQLGSPKPGIGEPNETHATETKVTAAAHQGPIISVVVAEKKAAGALSGRPRLEGLDADVNKSNLPVGSNEKGDGEAIPSGLVRELSAEFETQESSGSSFPSETGKDSMISDYWVTQFEPTLTSSPAVTLDREHEGVIYENSSCVESPRQPEDSVFVWRCIQKVSPLQENTQI